MHFLNSYKGNKFTFIILDVLPSLLLLREEQKFLKGIEDECNIDVVNDGSRQ